MKSVFFSLFFYVVRIFFNWNIYHYIREKRVRLYTYWISPEFSSIGRECSIEKMRSLIGAKHISIGNHCSIGINAQLTAYESFHEDKYNPQIIIGNDVNLGDSIHVTAINSITICDGVLTGRRVTISDHSHGNMSFPDLTVNPNQRKLVSKGGVYIGKNVWIGDKASILPGVTIGEGCVIGANTVVTKDIPPFSVVVGSPCRIIKTIKN